MKKHLFTTLIMLSMLILNGCAQHAKMIIDPKGIDMDAYHSDLSDCQHIADQVESKVAEGAVGGAVIGALFGAIIGGHNTTRTTSAFGALSGGLGAGSEEHYQRKKVLRNCLHNRGYQILN